MFERGDEVVITRDLAPADGDGQAIPRLRRAFVEDVLCGGFLRVHMLNSRGRREVIIPASACDLVCRAPQMRVTAVGQQALRSRAEEWVY